MKASGTPDMPVEISGRILIEAQDGGVLLEERNGRIRQLTPAVIESKTPSDVPFSAMSNDELGNDLLSQVQAGFEIHQTDHYVICSSSAEEYAQFVGKLLEKVFDQYFEFMGEQEIAVRQPAGKLPVIILQSEAEFKEFAAAQHPETSFEDTPGYYSLRDNQMLLMDLTRDRSLISRCRWPQWSMKRFISWPSIRGCKSGWLIIPSGCRKDWLCISNQSLLDQRTCGHAPAW
jgi:hypothetical protein